METLHQPNDIINRRYRIIAPLGQGSTGTTYEAEDLTNYQRVAIKAVSLRQATDWKILELFEREARVLANLNNPQIPKYLDYFQIETSEEVCFYLVLELIDGESLATLIEKDWHPTETQVKDIGTQVLKILEYLHSLTPPVIHRDIKPQNIIRRPDGRVYLVDFGAVQDVYRNTLTRGGSFVGTLGYMPLEQFRGQVKPASDLYSLGASLLFLLTGKSPVDLPQVRMRIDWRSQVKISADFANWLEQMLEPALEDRFSSAKEALKALSLPKFERRNIPVLTPKNPPPDGYRITVEITGDRVTIYIAPQGWNFTRIYRFLILMLIISFFIILVLQNISNIEWSWFIFLAMFFFPIGITMSGLLRAIYGSTTIKVNPETFSIEGECMGLKKKILEVKTVDIERLEIHVQTNHKNNNRVFSCILWEGIRQHRFGRNLSYWVQNWLVEELRHLIHLIQS